MASLASDRPNLPAPNDGANDPFVSSTPSAPHHRFSNFDLELFAAGPGSSPHQAKRALEAHIAETERRLDEAGKLGTALVTQRKALAEQLKEVEKQQTEGELNPELRQKLVEIEREYNDLARESARAFLPKQRVPSSETASGSPYVPEGRSGRRSVSPSKFESHATGSPTKLSVPNRKVRNQPTNRVHDIEFAAEISTSLIAQVRNLQALLSEREDEVKNLQGDKSRLEMESESLQQRFKTLDESEHRYKEENWNLETRLQETAAQQKEAADREKRLTQALNVSSSEKNTAQKELDEVKLLHSKLSEQHASAIKHHDIELGTAKRNMALAEGERDAMQRKIDDLTNQNSELAKAFAMQRGRGYEREPASGLSDDDFETATDNITPENSPPASPVKGTPRHSALETETMKTSLQHAQRTIQSQRSQLHREKTEKLEMRRIIQDLRDDLERSRNDVTGATSNRRSRKVDSKEMRKPPRLLGNPRSSQHEVLDDPEWEDGQDASPRSVAAAAARSAWSGDQFETANEASESAFETANERATETEDFQTGNEDLSDDGAATETEGARGFGKMRKPPSLPAGMSRHGNRESFHSTASTSADEMDFVDAPTPTSQPSHQKSRMRLNKAPLRGARQTSEEPMQSSPASFASSARATPQAGQSLFAELQDFDGSDDESVADTPSRRTFRETTPGSARGAVPPPRKVAMVDAGVMTEPVHIHEDGDAEDPDTTLTADDAERPKSMASVASSTANLSRPLSTMSYSDAGAQYDRNLEAKLAQFPVPPTSPPQVEPPSPPELALSSIQFEQVEPREEEAPAPPKLTLAPLSMANVEPRSPPETPPPALSLSSIVAHNLRPVSEPEVPMPPLTLTSIKSESVEPVAEPEKPPVFVPVEAPRPPAPELSISTIMGQGVEPVNEEIPHPRLAYSDIASQHVEPVPEPRPSLAMTPIRAEHTRPIKMASPTLALSPIAAQHIEPIEEPPMADVVPSFGFSPIESVETQPVSPRSPRRDGFVLPKDAEAPSFDHPASPETPSSRIMGSILSRGKKVSPPQIAEDETRQSPSGSPDAATPESQRPFKEISTNSKARPGRKPAHTNDQGAQTSLTSGAIDQLFKSSPPSGTTGFSRHQKTPSASTFDSPDTTGTVRIHRSQDNFTSPTRGGYRLGDDSLYDGSPVPRPESAASGRASAHDVPPLPSHHRQAIEAARSGSSSGQQGNMGPPLLPASAMKQQQQQRLAGQSRPMSPASARGGSRAVRTIGPDGTVLVHSPQKLTARSRQSSVSSFASEIDTRFNIRPGEMGIDPTGFGGNTDPRMIQAITQTMIGEFLWKYTRKTGRGELSENRHRRYFWVHPYTRTLYWSDRDPSTAGKTELKAKSVPIEAVRVVTDDNPMPPGLHRKSLVIISPGRTIKFTCATGQRHETWFNALSYLLLRSNDEAQSDAEDVTEHITQDDVDEFNPQIGRRQPGSSSRLRAPPSLSSYNSRTTRNESPADGISMAVPTLTPTGYRKQPTHKASSGTLSKLSGYWKSTGPKFSDTISSLRGRNASAQAQNAQIYEASQVHDSAEDLREMIEQQDREADRLENVRACCDGKHDVGHLHHTSKRGRVSNGHSHPAPSATSTPMASLRART